MQLRSNPLGIRYRITLMLELTSTGAILPSFDVETRIISHDAYDNMFVFSTIGLVLVIFFSLLEVVEVSNIGPAAYMRDVWNVMDWANYIVYYIVYAQVLACLRACMPVCLHACVRACVPACLRGPRLWSRSPSLSRCYPVLPASVRSVGDATGGAIGGARPQIIKVRELVESAPERCNSHLCQSIGYFDDWELLAEYRVMKTFLSICVCIQLFKILKFAGIMIPKMDITTAVLRRCLCDLLFFGITFVISMLAFSMMLFVQLGPVMQGYMNQIPAFISLFRALFGDFDIDEIQNNSSGYLNVILFLSYLFVSLFIMVSMFVAILAEAFVIENNTAIDKRTPGKDGYEPDYKEFGVLEQSCTPTRTPTRPSPPARIPAMRPLSCAAPLPVTSPPLLPPPLCVAAYTSAPCAVRRRARSADEAVCKYSKLAFYRLTGRQPQDATVAATEADVALTNLAEQPSAATKEDSTADRSAAEAAEGMRRANGPASPPGSANGVGAADSSTALVRVAERPGGAALAASDDATTALSEQLRELQSSFDTMGGLLLELKQQLRTQEDAMATLHDDVDKIGEVATAGCAPRASGSNLARARERPHEPARARAAPPNSTGPGLCGVARHTAPRPAERQLPARAPHPTSLRVVHPTRHPRTPFLPLAIHPSPRPQSLCCRPRTPSLCCLSSGLAAQTTRSLPSRCA